MWMSSQCPFPQLYSSPRFPGFRLAPNHLFISLMTSKLIYNSVISHSEEWELDSQIPVSVNCRRHEQWSPGSDGPPAATLLLGTICHHPSELMLSMCWSHSLRWYGLCDSATISKQNSMSHIPSCYMWHISLTWIAEIVPSIARNVWFVCAMHFMNQKNYSYLKAAVNDWSEELVCL